MRYVAAILACLIVLPAGAITVTIGDVAKSTAGCSSASVIICTPSPPTRLFDNQAQLKATAVADHSFLAFGPTGHLFGGRSDRSGIEELDGSFALVRSIPLQLPSNIIAGLFIAASGDMYVIGAAGELRILSVDGALEKSIQLPTAVGLPLASRFDVAEDLCTVFYTDEAYVGRRFDICNGQPLADLAPGPYQAIRALSDGGYIVARIGPSLEIYDANNRLLRTLAPPTAEISAMAFDPDPRFLWLGTETGLAKIRLDDGSIVASAADSPAAVLAVNGEVRPAAHPPRRRPSRH